jgi:hypothetical protein
MRFRKQPRELEKFGTLREDGVEIPYRYADTWARESTTGPDRIVVGASSGQIHLMSRLADVVGDPLFILYVLTEPRTDHEPGRYQSPYALERDEREAFLQTFGDFIECDGRHQFWLGAPDGSATLVYENHNLLYAYGPLESFKRTLSEAGLSEGPVEIPVPHVHYYHAEFDEDQARLVEHFEWLLTPLKPEDDSD